MKERNYFCWFVQRVKNTRGATYAQHTRNLCAMLLVLFMGIGQMWAADYSSLNYAGENTLPEGYNYYGSSAGTQNKGAFSLITALADMGSIGGYTFDVTAGGGGTYNKRCIEFVITEDCSLDITMYAGNAGRVLSLYKGTATAVHSVTCTDKNKKYEFHYDFTGATPESPQTYSLSSGGSKMYLTSITFTPAGGGSTDPVPVSITSPAADPAQAEIAFGETVKLSITATGYPAPEYQWYRNTSASTEGATEISGANAASYTTPADLAVGTYYFYCVADNKSGDPATSRFFPVKVNQLGADLTAHTPGVYEKAQASGGYGAALITYDEREYETYYLYAANSKLYMSAGNIKYNATGHKNLIDGKSYSNGVANVMDDSEDNWFSIAAQGYGNSKTPNSQQFNINTSGVTSANIRNTSKIRIKVSGYDNFSFMGNDNSSSNKFSVKIDGVTQDYTHNSSAMSIFSFDISTGEHYIEISSPQSSDSRFNAFSLRLPAVAKHHVTYAYGDASASGTLPTQEDVKEGFTFEVASGAGLTPPDGKEFDKWSDGTNGYSAGAIYTMGISDVTLTAVWKEHETSDDATLSDLTVGGETVTGFAAATIAYNVELPFGTNVVPTVAGTANSTFAKSVVVTPAASLPGSTTVVVTAENNSTKTYTINFTVADSKLIDLVWKTGQSACDGAGSQAAVINSSNAAVSTYIKPISFENAEGTGDNAAEGGSLNTGKKAGNVIIIQTKPGYLFTAMSFFGKIEEADTKCQISIDGGANWSDLASTSGGDAKYCNVVSGASTSDIRIKGCGSAGTWIRNMQLTITTGCSPVTLAWTPAPATEVEVGKAASVSAVANYGTVGYASNATGVIEVASDGALTVKALGSATITASVGGGDGTLYCAGAPSDINVTLNTYYLVEFDVQGGDAVLEDVKYFSGDAALTAPSAGSLSGFDFEGWFDAATGGNAIEWPLTPAASQKIYAHWTAQCAGPTITVQPVGANYIIGRTPAAISCTATAGNGGELTYAWYEADAEDADGVALAGAPVISTAAAMDKYYYCIVTEEGCGVEVKSDVIHVVVAPKDGVEIIRATHTGAKTANVTGTIGGTYDKNTQDGGKLGSNGHYLGIKLAEGSFLAGDVVKVVASTLNGGNTATLFSGKGENAIASPAIDEASKTATHVLTGPSEWIYLYRATADCNPTLGYIAVYRPMNPMLTAITINGEAGIINESAKTVAVELQPGYNLAALTIVPTIVSNTAEASVVKTVESNGGAWVIGDNTYRLTDKDGDYTEYTVTLSVGVLKHTVSFNTHGGSTIDPVQVVDGQKLAAAPADPEKEDYIFQGWAETEDGAIVDVTTFTIADDKEFHAVWAAETGVIKLIANDGNINTVDFITGVAKTTVTFDEVEHNGAAWSGTQGAISGTNQLGKVVQYNATTNQTKLKIKVYNTNNSAKQVYIHKILEGETTAEVETLDVASKTPVESVYYPFNSDENRSFYITTNSADVKILQVKVVDDGTTTLKRAGQVGYELNLNKGRVLYYANSDVTFEGLALASGSNYNVISATEFQTTKNLSFSISAPVTLVVTTNSAKYYVSQNAEENGATATAVTTAGEEEFNLTATGTWYLVPSTTSNVKYTKIAFEAPKCVVPVIETQPASKIDYTTGNDMTASVVASVTDGGTLSYQWYNAADNSEVTGATSATLTTTEPGTYYVIITNTKDGYQEASVQSDNATLKYRKADDASLIALTYGTEAITLIDGVYNYRVVLPADATAVPALSATATMNAYGATADVTNATAFEEFEAVSSVLVTAEDGITTQTYTVTFVVKHDYAKAEDVTGNTTWNWDGVASEEVKIVASEHGVVLANYISADNFEKLEGQDGARAYRSNTYPSYQGTYLKFHTTVPGRLTINARYASGADLIVNGKKLADLTGTRANYSTIVFTGDVEITSSTGEYRIYNMKFEELTPDYTRPVTEGRYGTICLPYDGLMGCATLYEVAYKDASKIYFDEVLDGSMTAGTPYIFLPNKGAEELQVIYTDNVAAPAGSAKGLVGFIGADEDAAKEVPVGSYILNNNQYRLVEYAGSAFIQSNRAYINLEAISTKASAPAPNRRRISMGYSGAQVATGIGEVQGDEVQSSKLLINGQLFILRGEKMYDATGRLVK